MKSVVIHKYGGPEVLEIVNTDMPELPADKVLVRVEASSVNPIDYKIRRGDLKIITGKKFPRMTGADFSGVIERAGERVDGYVPGDRVYGFLSAMKGGAWAEYLVADPAILSLKPEKFTFEEAASVPLAATTALQALNYLGNVSEGSSVLVNGATGGVGMFAVQIARSLGAEVTGTCSKENMELCRRLGAEDAFDYSGDELNRSGKKFDVFFDAAAKSSFAKCRRMLNPGGIYITTLPSAGVILRKFLNILPFTKKGKAIMARPSGIDLTILTGFAMTGEFRPVVENVFPLDQIRKACQLAEDGSFRGKIVIKIG